MFTKLSRSVDDTLEFEPDMLGIKDIIATLTFVSKNTLNELDSKILEKHELHRQINT